MSEPPTPTSRAERRAFLLEEARAAAQFDRYKYGPDGFRCPHCAWTAAYRTASRPRVRKCKKCLRETSVTAGTALHGTRIPLQAWTRFVEGAARALPTVSAVVAELGVARSTALSLIHRFDEILLSRPTEGMDIVCGIELPIRAARRALAASAYSGTVDLDRRHTAGERHLLAQVILTMSGDLASFECVGPFVNHDLAWPTRELRARLAPLLGPRRVSLRWMPIRVGGEIARNNLGDPAIVVDEFFRLAFSMPRLKGRAIDPWLHSV